MPLQNSIWLGYDEREGNAFAVARESCRKHLNIPIPIYGLLLNDLIKQGLYTRKIEYRPSAADRPVMWDVVSDAPQSTDHANARFFVPLLAKTGWALFCDGDVLFRGNVKHLFDQLDPAKAVYCVQHKHEAKLGVKMDGQVQTAYSRKNWSSVIACNEEHPANNALRNLKFLNTTPGRDLHALSWINDDNDIGELAQVWNCLIGYTDPEVSATIAHFTLGTPDMPGYADQKYADEWRSVRDDWARGSLRYDKPLGG